MINPRFIEIFHGLVPPVSEWSMRTFHLTMAVKGRQFIAYGINQARTHPLNLRNKKKNSSGIDFSGTKLICSELSCLLRVKRKTNIPTSKLTLINFRMDREGGMGLSKPCSSCAALLAFTEVRKVIYSTPTGFEIYEPN